MSQNPDHRRYMSRTPVTEFSMSTASNTRMFFVGHHAATGQDLWLYERVDITSDRPTRVRFARIRPGDEPRWMAAKTVAWRATGAGEIFTGYQGAYRFAYRRALARGLIRADGTLKVAL